MPSYVVRPGTTLADRYRLEEDLGSSAEATSWRAVDGLLHRPVLVHTMPAGAPGADALLDAARSAAQLADLRFLRVLDASAGDGFVYVVAEWVPGTDLATLVADGPLPAAEAGRLAWEVAEALAAAHAAGLSHLRLRPSAVLRTADGQVKIVGLAIEAARDPATASVGDTPGERAHQALEDARGCGAVLYAALTARWPGPDCDGLQAAPVADGHVCAPRQVRAGIPPELDDIASRALGLDRRGDGLRTPADVAEALRAAVAGPASWPSSPVPVVPAADDVPTVLAAPGARGPVSRLARASVAVVLAAGLGLGGWQLALAAQDRSESGTPSPSRTVVVTPTAAPPTGTVVQVREVRAFDPEGSDSEENDDRAERAVDGDAATVWQTSTYLQQLGPQGLKTGVGLVVDLGEPTLVGTVTLELEGRGTSVELGAADALPTDRSGFRTIATSPDSGPTVTLRPGTAVETRHLLIWLTELPQVGADAFRAGVAEVVVRGR